MSIFITKVVGTTLNGINMYQSFNCYKLNCFYSYSNACVELNRKSLMVEEAVEEVLDLVRKAAQQIKPTEINPDFEFLIAEGQSIR